METGIAGFGGQVADCLERVRCRAPLVHQITNFVVMNDTANATLAVGALPVMAHALEEVADMVTAARALVINPGTLEPRWVEAMILAGRRANEVGVPVVFDPVGAGATPYRTETAARILREVRIAVIRGNAGEVGTLAGVGGQVRGVESVAGIEDPIRVVRDLANRTGAVVAITGARDFLSNGRRVLCVDNGHPLMRLVTGTGCMATALIGAFVGALEERSGSSAILEASTAALVCLGLAGEIAATRARGPGSFRVEILDALHGLDRPTIEAGTRVIEP